MPFVVLYDANVLWGDLQRDLLIRVAQSGLVQAKWSNAILDDWDRWRDRFWQVVPKAMLERLDQPLQDAEGEMVAAE